MTLFYVLVDIFCLIGSCVFIGALIVEKNDSRHVEKIRKMVSIVLAILFFVKLLVMIKSGSMGAEVFMGVFFWSFICGLQYASSIQNMLNV